MIACLNVHVIIISIIHQILHRTVEDTSVYQGQDPSIQTVFVPPEKTNPKVVKGSKSALQQGVQVATRKEVKVMCAQESKSKFTPCLMSLDVVVVLAPGLLRL